MKTQHCFVCNCQRENPTKKSLNLIYDARGLCVNISLCYNHSVELFKRGQVNFIAKFEDRFQGQFGFDDNDHFLDQFNETRKRFLGNWFSRAS